MKRNKQNNVVVFTGAGGSIGRELAPMIAGRFQRVALVFHHEGEVADSVVTRCRAQGAAVKAYYADLELLQNTVRLIHNIIQDMGNPFAIVHSIGQIEYSGNSVLDPECWIRMARSNVETAINLTSSSWKNMVETGEGRYVFFGFSGSESELGFRQIAAYAAAKEALTSFMRSFALSMAPENITVNMVSPGVIMPAHRALTDFETRIIKRIPLNRLGETKDIFYVIDWLLSPRSAYITGQNIKISGGLHISSALS